MNDKITTTTDIISATGINITKYDILPAKVFINGVEVTDTESWNKAISTFSELENKINNLQFKIDKVNRILNANTHVENIYHALCNLFDEEYQYEIDNEELNKILKEDK